MVGDDAFRVGADFRRRNAAQFVQFAQDRLENFGVVAAGFALQHGGDAFHAHAGVHVLLS